MNTIETTSPIPTNINAWIEELNAAPRRAGWGAWDNVGGSTEEGVQNWSEASDIETGDCVGVWGVVVYPEDDTAPHSVEFSIYIGDCKDPASSGYDTAEDAQWSAEHFFPALFTA